MTSGGNEVSLVGASGVQDPLDFFHAEGENRHDILLTLTSVHITKVPREGGGGECRVGETMGNLWVTF